MLENILLILLLLLFTAKLIGGLFEKMGLDGTFGELLTGIIFGPSVLNMVHAESIEAFAIIGGVLILFIAGMKQEHLEEIYKEKLALKIGVTLLFVTFGLMIVFFYFVPAYFGVTLTSMQVIVLGLAFAVIDIGVPAKVLMSKGLMGTSAGRVTVYSAIINIILGLSVFTIITIFLDASTADIVLKLGGVLLFMAVTYVLAISLSRISKFVQKMHIPEAEFSFAIVLVLAMAYFSEVIGFSSVLGAFIAGAIIARTSFAETKSFSDKMKSLSFGLFIPLFFVWFGLEVNLVEIWEHLWLVVLVFLAYTSIRFVITYTFLKRNKIKMPGLISSSMLSVDVESLVILMVAMQLGIFTTELPLTLFAPSVLLSTLFIVLLVALFSKLEGTKKKVKSLS